MIAEPGAEGWRAKLDAVIKRYRNPGAGYAGMQLDDAIAELRKLGLTEGDALRYLGKPTPPLSG